MRLFSRMRKANDLKQVQASLNGAHERISRLEGWIFCLQGRHSFGLVGHSNTLHCKSCGAEATYKLMDNNKKDGK